MTSASSRLRGDSDNPDFANQVHVRRYFPAFYKLAFKGDDTYLFSSVSIRVRGGQWMVVVRADEISPLRGVVVFGSGSTYYDAFRNASLAIGKRQWKLDKFAGK